MDHRPYASAAPGDDAVPAAAARQHLAARLALVPVLALAGAVYSRSFDGPLVFDDHPNLVENPAVHSVGAWLASRPWNDPRAFSTFTFALDGSLHGGSVPGLHVTNLLVHLLATSLAYLVARAMFRSPRLASSSLRGAEGWIALGTAALFAVHPLQTQAVVYVVQRMASLSAALYLGAVLGWLRFRTAEATRPRAAWLSLSVLAAALALVTKQHTVTLPLGLLLLELALFDGGPRRLWALAPHTALAAAATLRAVLGRGVESAVASSASFAEGTPRALEYVLGQARIHWSYLRMLALPSGQSIDHPPLVAGSATGAGTVAAALALALLASAALTLLATAARRDPAWRLVAAGILWWFVVHAVESAVPLPDAMVEHRVYLPSFGPFLAFSVAAAAVARRLGRDRPAWRTAFLSACAASVLALATVAHARIEVWGDEVRLWSDAAEKAPGNGRAHHNVGAALLSRGRVVEAAGSLSRAAALLPEAPLPHQQLGMALEALGQRERAAWHRAEAKRLFARFQLRRGVELLAAGRPAEAAAELRYAVSAQPSGAAARVALGRALLAAGDARAATYELRLAASLAPHDAEIRSTLARAYLAQGLRAEAERALAGASAPAAPP